RTIKAGVWNTICLPFALSNEQMQQLFGEGVSLADFQGVTFKNDCKDMTLKFARVIPAAIEAYHPYIIWIDKDEEIKRLSIMETVKVDKFKKTPYLMVGENDDIFYGTTTVKTLEEIPPKETYPLFLQNNKFHYLTSESTLTLKAFRGYIVCGYTANIRQYVEENPANVNFFVDDEAIDGIDGVTTNKVVEGVYDLQGRKVNDEHLKRGVYIIDGKKVVVK
ncbi:MAG: hypothetical protein II674_05520, partial [Prevotella sp.]|nr:hypothetical protein [Prevotella sp.]